MTPTYVSGLDRVSGLRAKERKTLEPVAKEFEFGANDYYLSLIDWNDPDDPIRRIIIPDAAELEPSCRASSTSIPPRPSCWSATCAAAGAASASASACSSSAQTKSRRTSVKASPTSANMTRSTTSC
jgi:hypothetical protein